MKPFLIAVTVLYTVSSAIADVSHILNEYSTTTHSPPANPYVFSYAAGRAPGHVDRTHTEVSDGSGVIRGAFSYVDPRQQQYFAEAPHQSEYVISATNSHLALYNQIAQQHAAIGAQHLDAGKKHLALYDQIAQQHAAIGAQRLG